MSFSDIDKLKTFSTERLVEMIRKHDLPMDLELLENLVSKSMSMFDLMKKYEDKTGVVIPEYFSDNFLVIVELLWEREFPNIKSLNVVFSSILEMEQEGTISNPDRYREIFDMMIKIIHDRPEVEMANKLFSHYEVGMFFDNWIITMSNNLTNAEYLDTVVYIIDTFSEFESGQGVANDADEFIYQFELIRAKLLFKMSEADKAKLIYEKLLSMEYRQPYTYVSFATDLLDQVRNNGTLDFDEVNKICQILLKAKDLSLRDQDYTSLRISYQSLIDFLTFLEKSELDTQELPLEDKNLYKRKMEELDTSPIAKSKDDISQSDGPDLSKLTNIFIINKDEDIRVLLLCADCGLTYDVVVYRLFLSKQYLLEGIFGDQTVDVENGRIMLPKEVRCPTCDSYKYRVTDLMRSIIVINVNNEHETQVDTPRFRVITLDFNSKNVETITDVIKYWQRKCRKSKNNPTPYVKAARFLLLYNHYDLAKKYLLKALSLDRTISEAYPYLAEIYHSRSNLKKTYVCLKRMNQYGPSIWDKYVNWASSELIDFYNYQFKKS